MQKSPTSTEKVVKKKKSYQCSLSSSGSHLLYFANLKMFYFAFYVKNYNNSLN